MIKLSSTASIVWNHTFIVVLKVNVVGLDSDGNRSPSESRFKWACVSRVDLDKGRLGVYLLVHDLRRVVGAGVLKFYKGILSLRLETFLGSVSEP